MRTYVNNGKNPKPCVGTRSKERSEYDSGDAHRSRPVRLRQEGPAAGALPGRRGTEERPLARVEFTPGRTAARPARRRSWIAAADVLGLERGADRGERAGHPSPVAQPGSS